MRRLLAALLLSSTTLLAQQPIDAEYTRQIRENTTAPQFLTELVDHLPESATIDSPLEFNGYISGAEGKLTYAADVHRYMRMLASKSPRVKVFPIGTSEEGREMIVVAIADEATIANFDRYADITRRLADPRSLSDRDAEPLLAEGKPFYHLTGAIHSPETGSPEMLMELAYRLAVSDRPEIRAIRENIVTLITPVVEVDGRERQVDLWRYRQQHPGKPTPPMVYWGHYVAHDNNRDQIGLALALSRNILDTYFRFHPQVLHDLHESVPFLYISTGTGPYNPALDPIVIDAWHRMAYHEVGELTRRGMPGVWTHGFYDGWAPNYMFWAALGHNSIGRFYETFGNRWPMTERRVVRGASQREWYRPNPPLPEVKWSLRNNVNYQQSGVLLALGETARNRRQALEQFWLLGKRSVAKATNEGPAAYVLPADQKRLGQVHELLSLLRRHGIEVHQTTSASTVTLSAPKNPPAPAADAAKDQKPASVSLPKGSFVIRMDQPYSRLADTLLDVQFVRGDDRVYDDTGWTLGLLKNLDVRRVTNPDVLKISMAPAVDNPAPALPRGTVAIENSGDIALAQLRFAHPSARFRVASEDFTVGGRKFARGTIIADGLPDGATSRVAATALATAPSVATRDLRVPRIAVLHSWLRTQDEGWYRLALESMGIPYTYISAQDVSRTPALRDQFDVIIFPPVGSTPQDIVNGLAPGAPLPWKKTELTPNLGGIDETDDMRPGLGLGGVQNLATFVENGGLLITVRDTAQLAIDYGLVRWVRVVPSTKLKAPGSIVRGTVVDKASPVVAGYDETIPLVFAGSPLLRVSFREESANTDRPSGRGSRTDADVVQGRPVVDTPERPKPGAGEEGFQAPEDAPWNVEHSMPAPADRPRVLVRFYEQADQLLMSGMLDGGDELAGKAAVVAAPRGKGTILLFAVNPMWRMNTQGMYALVTNAIINWESLR
jgi:hypothetical protein